MNKKITILGALLAFSFSAFSYEKAPTKAFKKTEDRDFLLRADQVSHERDLNLVIARGNVKVSDGVEIVEADMVSYNQKLKIISASGNVRFYDKKGGLTRSNYMELSENFKKGFVEKASLLTKDDQRLTARQGLLDGNVTTFSRASYTPCAVCEGRTPMWHITSSKVTKDDDSHMLYYLNSVLNIKGIPVLYIPYFSHPDPLLERKNGFLMPLIGNNSTLGAIVGTPYYFSPNSTEEMIVKPIYISKKKTPMLGFEYRKYFRKAFLGLKASAINASNMSGKDQRLHTTNKRLHGHLFAEFRYDHSDAWRLNSTIERVSSPTYLKQYYFLENSDYRTKNYLTSQMQLERFDQGNYVSIRGLDFQNLNNDFRGDTAPLVTPLIDMHYGSKVGPNGEVFYLDGSQAYIDPNRGARSERLSLKPGVRVDTLTDAGIMSTFDTYVRGDYYDVKKHTDPKTSRKVSQGMGRAFPALSWILKYPLSCISQAGKWVVSPILGLAATPSGINNSKIPNSDSADFEYDTSNLFSVNRFSGHDLVDAGQRINYALQGDLFSNNTKKLHMLFGQSYSFSKTPHFNQYSGVRKGMSDYVGQVRYKYDLYSLTWAFRLGERSLKSKKHSVELAGGAKKFGFGVNYTYHDRIFYDQKFVKSEQLKLSLSSQFSKNWTVFANQAREFGYKRGELQHGGGLIYEDDCFKAKFDFVRTFYKDRDVLPSKTFMLTLGFKNLGEYSTGALNLENSKSPESQIDKI